MKKRDFYRKSSMEDLEGGRCRIRTYVYFSHGHYFTRQLSVLTSCWQVYRTDITQSADRVAESDK